MFVIAAGLVAQVLVFYVAWDVTFAWYLPDPSLGFKYYMDVYQTSAFWPKVFMPVGALLPFTAMLAAWVANRVGRLVGRRPRKDSEAAAS